MDSPALLARAIGTGRQMPISQRHLVLEAVQIYFLRTLYPWPVFAILIRWSLSLLRYHGAC